MRNPGETFVVHDLSCPKMRCNYGGRWVRCGCGLSGEVVSPCACALPRERCDEKKRNGLSFTSETQPFFLYSFRNPPRRNSVSPKNLACRLNFLLNSTLPMVKIIQDKRRLCTPAASRLRVTVSRAGRNRGEPSYSRPFVLCAGTCRGPTAAQHVFNSRTSSDKFQPGQL